MNKRKVYKMSLGLSCLVTLNKNKCGMNVPNNVYLTKASKGCRCVCDGDTDS